MLTYLLNSSRVMLPNIALLFQSKKVEFVMFEFTNKILSLVAIAIRFGESSVSITSLMYYGGGRSPDFYGLRVTLKSTLIV
jgi:hypothetical protein